MCNMFSHGRTSYVVNTICFLGIAVHLRRCTNCKWFIGAISSGELGNGVCNQSPHHLWPGSKVNGAHLWCTWKAKSCKVGTWCQPWRDFQRIRAIPENRVTSAPLKRFARTVTCSILIMVAAGRNRTSQLLIGDFFFGAFLLFKVHFRCPRAWIVCSNINNYPHQAIIYRIFTHFSQNSKCNPIS